MTLPSDVTAARVAVNEVAFGDVILCGGGGDMLLPLNQVPDSTALIQELSSELDLRLYAPSIPHLERLRLPLTMVGPPSLHDLHPFTTATATAASAALAGRRDEEEVVEEEAEGHRSCGWDGLYGQYHGCDRWARGGEAKSHFSATCILRPLWRGLYYMFL